MTYIIALFLLLLSNPADARIEDVEYAAIQVNGVFYDVPIHEPDFTAPKVFILKKALKGDLDAYDLVPNETYIGEEYPKWLIKDGIGGFIVKEYP